MKFKTTSGPSPIPTTAPTKVLSPLLSSSCLVGMHLEENGVKTLCALVITFSISSCFVISAF